MLVQQGNKQVVLKEHQIEHFARIARILASNHFAFDTSPTGAGKSYSTAAIAIHYNFRHVLVVCPKTVKVSWDEVIVNTGIPVVSTITYQTLRGVSRKAISHPYLTRHDHETDATVFAPTEALRTILREGALLVFDEVQNIKNNSDQMKAARAMITLLLGTAEGNSRVLFLSGSPFDKEEHSINFMRCLGFIRHRNLYTVNHETGEIQLRGAQELIDVCEYFDRERTRTIVETTEIRKGTVQPMCFQLFCQILKTNLMSAMDPPTMDVVKDIKNGYYHLEDQIPLLEAIGRLGRAAHYQKDTETYNEKEADWGAITKALMSLESAKIPIFVRLSRKRLTENTTNQVVIFCNYTNNLLAMEDQLREFNPMLLHGDTSDRKRATIIQSFQEGTCRLLISNMKVGGVGINLHDTMGGRVRFVYGSPNYMAIDMHQATGRVYREGTLSSPVIRWIYGEVGQDETSILNALARKRAVLETILDTQVRNGIVFPGGYDVHHYTLDDE